MDDDLLFIREAQSVFADKGDGKGLTVHGFFSTGPVHKLIFSLQAPKKKKFFCRAVNHLFLNFHTNFLCLQFPIIWDHLLSLVHRIIDILILHHAEVSGYYILL